MERPTEQKKWPVQEKLLVVALRQMKTVMREAKNDPA